MSFAPPESKNKDDGPSLLCSVDGCTSRWSVKLDGQMPKCSFHQWQQPKVGKHINLQAMGRPPAAE